MSDIFLKSISKTIDLITSGKIKDDEADRIGNSDYQWAIGKSKKYYPYQVKRGDIFQFDFGKNLEPEMSYEHRGLVIGKSGQLLYVLPIFSYIPNKHIDLYDATSKPQGNLYLLEASKYKFLKHDSVMKINDLRTVSTKRIMYHQANGHVDISSDFYKEVESLVFSRCFPSLHYELNQLRNQK